MSQREIQAIQDQITSLPKLPATVNRVLATTAGSKSRTNDLVQAIQPDQAMCSTILDIVNSTAYKLPKKVQTIKRAVEVLGFDEIKNLIIGKAILAFFPKHGKDYIQGIGVFWEHAFTCGIMAKIIGEHYLLSPSELFISGLIHDIGKLVMLSAFPNRYPLLEVNSLASHFQATGAELEQFGTKHDAVGLQLAKHWSLPEQLASAIGYHHTPDAAPHFKQQPMIVQVADILSLMYCCAEITEARDVQNIFEDFLAGTRELWERNGLTLQPDTLGLWFEILQDKREKDQEILTLLSA